MKLKIEKSVTVITPTIGKKQLAQACESVANQTYSNIHHLLVVDGSEYWNKTIGNIALDKEKSNLSVTVTPNNTGQGGFYGHRIYAAYPHLINTDYIAFLDEDNWWEPNHIESLMDLIDRKGFDWAYSLRNVYIEDTFHAKDCCESTGKYPIYISLDTKSPAHLVDTSSYIFRTDWLIMVCNHWHSGWGGDRRFYEIITQNFKHTNFGTTGLHTLNYRLPDMDRAYGGQMDWFEKGNRIVKEYYGGNYPWIS